MNRYNVDLTKKPYALDEQAIGWVEDTLSGMTMEQKVGQLFCLPVLKGTLQELDDIFALMQPGGMMYRPIDTASAIQTTEELIRRSPVPMLIAANLEKGGNGIVTEGTLFASPMAVAATGDTDVERNMARVCAAEGKAVGANWSFAPIIDIDYNYHNPITNTRTFGSNPELVADMGEAYVQTVQEMGMASCIKHFPGDGCDERDQHLVVSINDKSVEEWERTYGMVYRRCIEAGAMTLMAGHIAQPAWSRKLRPDIKDEDILPATLSEELLGDLLRGHLRFNGLISTDATTMAGFTIPMPRQQAVPHSIRAGADVFLFTRNMHEDYEAMLEGARSGYIPAERLDDAVRRILGLKAALGLHKQWKAPDLNEAQKVIGCEAHKRWAVECADKAVTLVKNKVDILPLSPQKYPRVLFYPIEAQAGVEYSAKVGVCDKFREMLIAEGFEVDIYEPQSFLEGNVMPSCNFTDNYDLCIYVANLVTKSNQTVVRIEWQQPMGANCPHYGASIPTLFISVENPYHLLDVPSIKTFINAYCSTDQSLQAVMDKLLGRSDFKGSSPVDAFCGRWDTKR